jgi:nucleotide-binding universal stress UspA family protein
MSSVLIAIDGSESALKAVNTVIAGELFPATTEITLIHVHLPIPSPRAVSWVGSEVVNKYYDDEAEAALASARAALTAAGRKFDVIKRVGDPGHEIAKTAADGFKLVVMGTHGRTALGNLLMGSVATRAIAESRVPIMLVR